MRALKYSAIASLLLLVVVPSGLVGMGCGGDARGQASPSPSQIAPPVAAASPSPTAHPTLDAAARFGAVHADPLPAFDEGTTWTPRQLIPGSHLFLVFNPPGYLGCEGCQFPPGDPEKPGRLGLWNIDTGTVDEFRTLQAGDQIPATASDGRFLVWAEGCDHGIGGGWDLYAMDLATEDWWYVDTDFSTISGDSWLDRCPGPTDLAITGGRLVYSTAIANLSGRYLFEVRTHDLSTRSGSILQLSGGDVPPIHVGCSACGTSAGGLVAGGFSLTYASDGRVFWFGDAPEACANGVSAGIYVTDLSNGDTKLVVCWGNWKSALGFLTGSDQGRNPAVSRWEDHLQITSGFVFWVDRPEDVAMAYDRNSGDLIKLSDCSVNLLAADDDAIYWTCGDQLNWVDLPH